jgi:hypothetical protein
MSHAPRTTIWDIPELTSIKHRILRGYLERWLPDVLQKHERIYLLDGFCGPGEYTGGEIGSPPIAIDVLHRCTSADPELQRKIRLVFIDEDYRRCDYLYDLLEERKRCQPAIANLSYCIERGHCIRKLDTRLTGLFSGSRVFEIATVRYKGQTCLEYYHSYIKRNFLPAKWKKYVARGYDRLMYL